MVALSILSLLLAPAALAAPSRRDGGFDSGFHGACDVSQSTFADFPQSFDQLTADPIFVLMGVGIQNYTCNSGNTYDSIGAVGQLWDISCIYQSGQNQILTDAFNAWSGSSEIDPLSQGFFDSVNPVISQYSIGQGVIGQHYFANLDGGNNNPEAVWDFTSGSQFYGNPGAIVYAHKVKTTPAPNPTNDIAWVELTKDSGELANTVYRIETISGVADATCDKGQQASFKYGTIYLLSS